MVNKSYTTVKSTWGHNINNLYLTHNPKSDTIVILFPGADYSCDKPLLHYARKVGLLSGCDVLCLEYGYFKTSNFYHPDYLERTLSEVKETIQLCLSNPYKHIYFISKSLGTIIAGEVSSSLGYEKIHNLFLTPIASTFQHITSTKCTVVIGSKDKQFPAEYIEKIRTLPSVALHIIDNAAHSLEVEDSWKESIEILSVLTNLYERFVDK